VVQQVVATVTASIGFAIAGPYGAAAGYGFGSSFSGTLLAGGSIGDALRAGLQGGVTSLASAGAANGVGDLFSKGHLLSDYAALKPIAHGVVQGGIRQASGGDFTHGFLSATFSDIAGGFTKNISGFSGDIAARTAIASAIGGTAEVLGGGKFGNGAVTGAFVHLFNHEMHRNDFNAGMSERYERAEKVANFLGLVEDMINDYKIDDELQEAKKEWDSGNYRPGSIPGGLPNYCREISSEKLYNEAYNYARNQQRIDLNIMILSHAHPPTLDASQDNYIKSYYHASAGSGSIR